MLNKLKSKFKNFASCWKFEKHLIKTCNRATPLHQKVCGILSFVLCFVLLLFLVGSISASADEGVTPRAVPTDLTGYSVILPAGWSATAGYGRFYVDGTYASSGSVNLPEIILKRLDVGYALGTTESNSVICSGGNTYLIDNSSTLTFYFSGGTDVSNPSLIQWLADNNATFSVGSTPEPETSSIAGGIYHFKQFGNLPDIPDAGWSDGEGYSYGYTVAGKYVTTSRTYTFTSFFITFDEYVSDSHYTITFSVSSDSTDVPLATYSVSYGTITLETRSDLKYIVFDEPLEGTYDDIEFIRDFLVSGFPDTDTSPTDNPWLYILEMIIEALKVDLFGYFSVWDIFTTICGIFIVTWLLKLLAGG